MNFHVMTLFPEMISAGLNESIIGRAIKAGHISINLVNIRDFAPAERKGRVDDYPFGGGAGMVMQAAPIDACYASIVSEIEKRKLAEQKSELNENEPAGDQAGPKTVGSQTNSDSTKSPRVIYVTPQGKVFNQEMARELAKEEDLIFLCGHYEGVDERILDKIVTDQVSIGDYVLTGGELPAMVMIDAISRNVPGVLTNSDSGIEESFYTGEEFPKGLLEYPQYTRPAEYDGVKVPEILLSGDHAKVAAWRREQAIKRTRERRPDLLEND